MLLFLLINKHRGGEREQTTEGHHNMKAGAFQVQPDIAKIDDRIIEFTDGGWRTLFTMKKKLFSGVNPDDSLCDISVSILPRVPDESRGTPDGPGACMS